jgi:hypothetical protein
MAVCICLAERTCLVLSNYVVYRQLGKKSVDVSVYLALIGPEVASDGQKKVLNQCSQHFFTFSQNVQNQCRHPSVVQSEFRVPNEQNLTYLGSLKRS